MKTLKCDVCLSNKNHYLCVITCPSSCVLWENILNWLFGPSSAAGEWAASPLLGWDATEKLPAVEAPEDTHGPHWPPKHTHTHKPRWDSSNTLLSCKSPVKVSYQPWGKCILYLWVPADRPGENLRGSSHPGACRDGGCAKSPGSQCRCREPETEPSGPHVELVPPSYDSTAADAPKHSLILHYSYIWYYFLVIKMMSLESFDKTSKFLFRWTNNALHPYMYILQRGTETVLLR